jgi:hypothetical protein
MHELGHLLGLRHGGGDNVNCKPNYLSIMNYTRQFSDFITARPLTYSSALLNPLNESALDEQLGLSITSADRTVYSGGTFNTGIVTLVGPDINWDLDANNAETAAVQDVNKIVAAGCDGLDGTASLSVLQGYDDWAEIRYNARASLDFAGGTEDRDKTSNEEQASFELRDRDPDGVPDGQACGNPLGRCFIDIMPNQDPNLVNLGNDANIAVAIVSTPDFDAPTRIPNALRSQLTLNEQSVKINNNGDGSCHVQDVSSVITVPDPETGQPVQAVSPTPDGLKDLVCQFPSITLPLGRNFAVIDGVQTLGSTTSFFRARDLVTVR